jgi:hypothetical protein
MWVIDLTIEIGGFELGHYQDQAESEVTHASIGQFISLVWSAHTRLLLHALPKKVTSHEPSLVGLDIC